MVPGIFSAVWMTGSQSEYPVVAGSHERDDDTQPRVTNTSYTSHWAVPILLCPQLSSISFCCRIGLGLAMTAFSP